MEAATPTLTPSMLTDEPPASLVGADSIAHALGLHLDTVRLHAREGRLPVHRLPAERGKNRSLRFDVYAVAATVCAEAEPAEAFDTSRRIVLAALDHHATKHGKPTLPQQAETLLSHLPDDHPFHHGGLEEVDLGWTALGDIVLTSGSWTWALAADGEVAIATRTREDGLRDVIAYREGRVLEAGTSTNTN
jgi:hypothetical protein